jgi:hypothetical protein
MAIVVKAAAENGADMVHGLELNLCRGVGERGPVEGHASRSAAARADGALGDSRGEGSRDSGEDNESTSEHDGITLVRWIKQEWGRCNEYVVLDDATYTSLWHSKQVLEVTTLVSIVSRLRYAVLCGHRLVISK